MIRLSVTLTNGLTRGWTDNDGLDLAVKKAQIKKAMLEGGVVSIGNMLIAGNQIVSIEWE